VFGINGAEAVVILVLAVLLVGPARLPHYARQFGRFIRSVRAFAEQAKAKTEEELGPEFVGQDWSALDPRQYDPRQIIRDALSPDAEKPRQASN
jgi:sec-independent protein translocase protein TatB